MLKRQKGTLWAVFLLLAFFVAIPAQAADIAKKPLLYTFVSATRITDQDTINLTALSATPQGEPVDRITITVNGEKKECGLGFSCQETFGPFKVTKQTWIRYEVVAVKKGIGNQESGITKRGSILVTPLKLTAKPVFTKITTSGHQLKTGDTFDLKIYTKDEKAGIAKIEIYLDGKLMDKCEGSTECGTTFGPFADNDIGEHKYEFLVVNKVGNSIKPWGKFWVKAGAVSTPQTTPTSSGSGGSNETSGGLTATITPNKTEALSTDKIIFNVATEDDKLIKKIEILVNATLVKTCENVEVCEYIGGPYPNYAGTMVSYAANAYDVVGRQIFTGYKYLKITQAPNESIDKDAPRVTIEGNVFTETGTFGYGANFVAKAVDQSKIYKTEIYVVEEGATAGGAAQTCSVAISPATCEAKLDYLNYGKKYSYWAVATDSQGNIGTSSRMSLTVPNLTTNNTSNTSSTLVTMTPYKSTLTNNEIVDFQIEVKTVARPERINLYVDEKLVSYCGSLASCYYQGGPYVSPNSYYPYQPTYYAEAIYSDGSKILSTKKNLIINAGDSKTGYNTDITIPRISMDAQTQYFSGNNVMPSGYSIKMTAYATDDSGTIAKIKLYYSKVSNPSISPVWTCPLSASPYTCKEQQGTLEFGTRYQYYAEAFDSAGNKATSEIKYLDTPAR